jgi:hypothetical protein
VVAAERQALAQVLGSVRTGFARMAGHPCPDHRAGLRLALARLAEDLRRHLRRVETGVLPLLQRHLTRGEWADSGAAAAPHEPRGELSFLVPWVLDEITADGRRRVLALAGRAYGVLHAVHRPAYLRLDAVAFRHV